MVQLLRQTRPITDFLPHVLANTFGDENDTALPDSAATSYIRNSIISFAERSGIVKRKIKVDLQCGLDCYPLLPDHCDEYIVRVNEAEFNCRTEAYDPANTFHDKDCGLKWHWGDVCFEVCDGALEISPHPDQDMKDGLKLEIITAPTRDACDVDCIFYDKWFDAIINGALAEIHLMPNRPWSSNSKADYRRRLFHEDISRASTRKALKETKEPLKMRPNYDWFKYRTSQRRW